MKIFRKTLFVISMVFALSACSFSFNTQTLNWQELKNDGSGISLESNKVSKTDLSFNGTAFASAMKEADEAAVNRSSSNTFVRATNNVFNYFSSLRTKLSVARAKYYAYGSNYQETYTNLYEQLLSFYTWYYPFLLHVRDSSNEIYNAFFEDMTKQEIDDLINNMLYTDETKKIDSEIEDIKNEQEEAYNAFLSDFRAGLIKVGDEKWHQYLDNSLNRFRTILTKGSRMAELYGYDNYLDYVYKMYYNRDYKYDFVDSYSDLVDKYVIPMTKYYNEHQDYDKLTTAQKKMFETYNSSNIADSSCFQGDALDSYVSMMGGDMAKAYNHLKSSGYYLFSNSVNSLGTAYVASSMDEPLIFFSKGYQNTTSIVHEFGHYNAAYNNKNNSSFPFDIEETHSQGNEMLFNYYLTDYYKDDVNLVAYQYIQDHEVYEMLNSCILPTAVAKVETYIFENLDKSNDVLLTEINNIMANYRALYGDGYDLVLSYWATPIVSSTGYYISYATSGVASVGIYIKAKQNFEMAKEEYKKFVAYPNEEQDIAKFFTYSGLYSPLDESTFQMFSAKNLYSF